MLPEELVASIMSHLGGEQVLTEISACNFVSDTACVSFELRHTSPKGAHSVVISVQPRGYFAMECYGRISPGTFKAPLIGSARQILPENLATVLGQLTGIENLHHRHF